MKYSHDKKKLSRRSPKRSRPPKHFIFPYTVKRTPKRSRIDNPLTSIPTTNSSIKRSLDFLNEDTPKILNKDIPNKNAWISQDNLNIIKKISGKADDKTIYPPENFIKPHKCTNKQLLDLLLSIYEGLSNLTISFYIEDDDSEKKCYENLINIFEKIKLAGKTGKSSMPQKSNNTRDYISFLDFKIDNAIAFIKEKIASTIDIKPSEVIDAGKDTKFIFKIESYKIDLYNIFVENMGEKRQKESDEDYLKRQLTWFICYTQFPIIDPVHDNLFNTKDQFDATVKVYQEYIYETVKNVLGRGSVVDSKYILDMFFLKHNNKENTSSDYYLSKMFKKDISEKQSFYNYLQSKSDLGSSVASGIYVINLIEKMGLIPQSTSRELIGNDKSNLLYKLMANVNNETELNKLNAQTTRPKIYVSVDIAGTEPLYTNLSSLLYTSLDYTGLIYPENDDVNDPTPVTYVKTLATSYDPSGSNFSLLTHAKNLVVNFGNNTTSYFELFFTFHKTDNKEVRIDYMDFSFEKTKADKIIYTPILIYDKIYNTGKSNLFTKYNNIGGKVDVMNIYKDLISKDPTASNVKTVTKDLENDGSKILFSNSYKFMGDFSQGLFFYLFMKDNKPKEQNIGIFVSGDVISACENSVFIPGTIISSRSIARLTGIEPNVSEFFFKRWYKKWMNTGKINRKIEQIPRHILSSIPNNVNISQVNIPDNIEEQLNILNPQIPELPTFNNTECLEEIGKRGAKRSKYNNLTNRITSRNQRGRRDSKKHSRVFIRSKVNKRISKMIRSHFKK